MNLTSTYIGNVGGEGMIRLRIPSKDDLHLYRLIIKRLLPMARKAQPKLQMSKKKTFLRLNKSKVFVSVRTGKPPFGFISMKINQRILFIDLLAVEASDVNRGWGSRLMETGEQYGKKKGCFIARVFVDKDNDHAIAFYEKKGYEIQEYVPIVHCYLLQKNLESNNK
jgi:ribosomal protein S18 acetylase RimI-like enzyme